MEIELKGRTYIRTTKDLVEVVLVIGEQVTFFDGAVTITAVESSKEKVLSIGVTRPELIKKIKVFSSSAEVEALKNRVQKAK